MEGQQQLQQHNNDDGQNLIQLVDLGNNFRLQLIWSSSSSASSNSTASDGQFFDILVSDNDGTESSNSPRQQQQRRLRVLLQQCSPPANNNNNNKNVVSSSSSPLQVSTNNMETAATIVVTVDDEECSTTTIEKDGPPINDVGSSRASVFDDHQDNNEKSVNDLLAKIDKMNHPHIDNDDDEDQSDVFVQSTSFGFSSSSSSSMHELFWGSRPVTLDDVQHVLEQDPTAASAVESTTGKFPLHVLSEHHNVLLQTQHGRDEATRIVRALIRAYPAAMTTTDGEGNMPFVATIKAWVTSIYEEDACKQMQLALKTSSLIDKFVVASLTPIAKLRASTGAWSSPDPNSHGSLHRNSSSNDSDPNNSNHNNSSSVNNNASNTMTTTPIQSMLSRTFSMAVHDVTNGACKVSSSRVFPVTSLTDEVVWCFEMLSLCLDEMAELHRAQQHQQQQQPGSSKSVHQQPSSSRSIAGPSRGVIRECRVALATNLLQQVPLLIKSLLLLEDSALRERLWSLSICRQMLVNEAAIGSWLNPMLQRHGMPSQRAIDFFALVSESKVADLIGQALTPSPDDKSAFEMEQGRVFESVEALGEIIPSLALLNDPKEIERAATTSVVWFVMNKELSSPFTVGLILMDLVLHVTLLLSFRSQANLPRKGSGGLLSNVPVGIVLTICAHYLIRKITEGLALLNISPVLMRRYFWNIWRILDLATIVITIGAISWASRNPGRYRPSWNAIVLFLLWMKVLSFLKVVNRETATFILSLFEIIKDIRNFMLVLFVIILMFADMIHLLITTDEGHFCSQSPDHLDGSQIAFCSPALIDGYLRTYVILLNDFDLQSFRESGPITFVFILYTLLGSIIMLNVLIAVINESYQKSRISSALLFGRARVGFVAEHTALEQFLQPGRNPFEQLASISSSEETTRVHPCGKYLNRLAMAGRWLVLLSLLGTAASSLVYLVGKAVIAPKVERSIFVTIVFSILSVLLSMAMMVVTHSCFAGLVTGLAPRAVAQRVVAAFDFPVQHITRFVSVHLFGLTGAPLPVGFFKTFRLIHRGGHNPTQHGDSS